MLPSFLLSITAIYLNKLYSNYKRVLFFSFAEMTLRPWHLKMISKLLSRKNMKTEKFNSQLDKFSNLGLRAMSSSPLFKRSIWFLRLLYNLLKQNMEILKSIFWIISKESLNAPILKKELLELMISANN